MPIFPKRLWYLVRQSDGWQWVSLALLMGHFLIPFFGMISRHVRRSRVALVIWASFILLMHWLDLYWLIMPQLSPTQPIFGIWDLLCLVGFRRRVCGYDPTPRDSQSFGSRGRPSFVGIPVLQERLTLGPFSAVLKFPRVPSKEAVWRTGKRPDVRIPDVQVSANHATTR
jgi:hypothetical protein